MESDMRKAAARLREKVKIIASLTDSTEQLEATRTASKSDVSYFAFRHFSHLCRLNFSRMHWDLMRDYDRAITPGILGRTGHNRAIAAPRGAAKSTLVSLIFPLHAVCHGLERYILIISATQAQARQRLRNLRRELRDNQELAWTFGTFDSPGAAWTTQSLNVRGIQLDALSAGTEMRGVSLGAFRPTLIILDDVENSAAVASAEQRGKLRQWFHEVVENLGDRYTRLEVIGTLMHPDSLLRGLMRRPDFSVRSYGSILQWAEAGELWEEWKGIYVNLADPRRRHNARRFFEARRAAMLAGTKVLWKEKEDYYALMEQMVTRGRRAFFQEKQNDPLAESDSLFRLERFAWFEIEDDLARPATPPDFAAADFITGERPPHCDFPPARMSDMDVFGFLDPAMGARAGGGDFAAIAVIGRDPGGVLYVVDVWRHRAAPTDQAQRVYDLHAQWNFALFGIEANLFQELMTHPLDSEAARRKPRPKLNFRLVRQRANKERRLLAMEAAIANGWLRFRRNLPRDAMLEFADFPRSVHDDAMDAIEGAVMLAREGRTTAIQTAASRTTARAASGF